MARPSSTAYKEYIDLYHNRYVLLLREQEELLKQIPLNCVMREIPTPPILICRPERRCDMNELQSCITRQAIHNSNLLKFT